MGRGVVRKSSAIKKEKDDGVEEREVMVSWRESEDENEKKRAR